MDQRKATIYTIIFVFLLATGFFVTFQALSSNYAVVQDFKDNIGKNIQLFAAQIFQPKNNSDSSKELSDRILKHGCTNNDSIHDLSKSKDESLKRISQLQDICKSFATNEVMIFIEMPNNDITANRLAVDLSKKLKEYSKYNVTPIVIVEPETDWGLVDFQEFGTGFYSVWIEKFFSKLKKDGIKEDQMGIWVPFPEANLPSWNSANTPPEQVGTNINIYARILKKYYPQTKVSVLLNALSYSSQDYMWENGAYTSLVPYIKTLDKGLIDSFGIQGFPWRSPGDVANPLRIYDPVEFLNVDLAVEAANYLNVKKIWINTGTFGSKYANNPDLIVTIDSQTRKKILSNILKESVKIRNKGFSVSINIFAENKKSLTEATDWSYWGKNTNEIDEHTRVFTDFIRDVYENNIDLWIYDYAH